MEKYYLLGIGGISMSSLAVMLKEKGRKVSGSDLVKSRATKMLEEKNIQVDFEINKEKIKDADVIVCSSAIKEDNEQLVFAKELGKKIISRGQLLGQLSREYQKVIAITGSHGKTTTTGLIFHILSVCGKKPTLHLGGCKVDDGLSFSLQDKKYFVTEACEYYDNFLHLQPYVGVITNLEKEHMDYFKTFKRQKRSFEKFKKNCHHVIEGTGDFYAKKIKHNRAGFVKFCLYENKKKLFCITSKFCDEVNVQNMLTAFAVSRYLGLPDKSAKQALESFRGIKTRFEKTESKFFDNVVLDYAHHPTEIEKAISCAKKIFKKKNIVTIFQPHTFSRTKSLLDDFLRVFKEVDTPFFFKTYSAREKESEGISSKQLCKIISKENPSAEYFDNFDLLFDRLSNFDKKKTVLLFLGAGDLPEILSQKNFCNIK